MLNKKTVDDLKDLKGKKVLVRCDFNVPLKDGVIQNYNRIDGAIPTIKKLLDQGAKVILCSHLGKPKGEPVPAMSLAPVAPALSERLGVEVKFVSDPKVTGPETQALAAGLEDGQVLLLENTRYRVEETKYGKDPAADEYAKELAALCDNGIFVNDAFGTAHRAHCSNVGVTKYTKENVVGYLMEKEIKFLGQAVENPVRPFVAILGGAKVSDKIKVREGRHPDHRRRYGLHLLKGTGPGSWKLLMRGGSAGLRAGDDPEGKGQRRKLPASRRSRRGQGV